MERIVAIEKAKIMVSLATPLLDRLNEKTGQLGLRRDSYISRLLATEFDEVEKDLVGKRNSDQGKNYLKAQLRTLPITPVSISLDKPVIAKLSAICEKFNVDRDCLLNRIIFFLVAERKHLLNLGISETSLGYGERINFPVNSLDGAYELIQGPFTDLRQWMKDSDDESEVEYRKLYLWNFQGNIIGLNCVIEDYKVPGTKEYIDPFLNI